MAGSWFLRKLGGQNLVFGYGLVEAVCRPYHHHRHYQYDHCHRYDSGLDSDNHVLVSVPFSSSFVTSLASYFIVLF